MARTPRSRLGWLLVGALIATAADCPAQSLRVGDGGRHFVGPDGEPFFWLGDTAWELFHRLDREEAVRYLSNRAAKGFTVIQAVVLAELGGLTEPNPYGHLPLEDRDPSRPVEAYFEHVDFVVDAAAERGLVVGMLPSWGSHWRTGRQGSVFTPENARAFGRFLGERYREKPIVWILGGDTNIDAEGDRTIVDAMAEGLKEGDGGRHLMTYHPRGPGLSSLMVHDADWLDFHMYQSSHAARDHDNGLFAEHDYALEPVRPTLDGEPRYECIPVGFYFRNMDPIARFDDFDARRAAYWSILAGAAGHTYGNHNVWQMWAPGREPKNHADIPWWEAIDHPGAFQMGHVRKLFESRPFGLLRPDPDLVVDGPRTGGAKIRAARAEDGSFAFVYSPMGEPFTVDDTRIRGLGIRQIWYDPRYGVAHFVHGATTRGFQTFTPPSKGRGNDWILILEDADAGFPLPGR